MNLKTRARNLRKITGWAYQKCLQAIRAAGSAPAELAKAKGWSILRADVVTIAPAFDIEQSGTIQRKEEISTGVKDVDMPAKRSRPRNVVLNGGMVEFDARVSASKKYGDPMSRMMEGVRAAALEYCDPMSRMTKGILAASEEFRRSSLLGSMTSSAEKFGGSSLLGEVTKSMASSAEKLGAAGLAGSISKSMALSAEKLGAASLAGSINKSMALSAEKLGAASLAGSINKSMALSAEKLGAAGLAGSMGKSMALSAEKLGAAGLAGSMSKSMALSAEKSGASSALASMARDRLDPMGKLGSSVFGTVNSGLDLLSKLDSTSVGSLLSATKSPLASLEKLGAASFLDKMGGSAATMYREDRLQWLGLHVYDKSIPSFQVARAVAGSGFASIIETIAAGKALDARSYSSIVSGPSRAFTSYMERTGELARAATPRGREVLGLALALGSTHFRATSDVTARLLAQKYVASADGSPRRLTAPVLDLLDLERDELVSRAALDEDVPVAKVAEDANIVRLAALVRDLLTCVVDCNETARFAGNDGIFSHTNRTARASALLPGLLPRNLNSFKEAVEHLYFLIYEGAGGQNLRFEAGNSECGVFQRMENPFRAVMDLKFLRSKWLCHDLEHGGHGAKKNYEDLKRVFERLGLRGVPASPEEYQEMYLRLVRSLHSFLAELRERLRGKFS